jgi:large subunit ribosomal protein L10
MPNAKVLSEKQAVVAALVERLQNASAGVFVDYKGITVAEDTALRSELRQNEVEYSVVKNTLVRFALDKCGLEELDGILNGTTSLATSTSDPIVPIRLIHEASEKMKDKFTIKGAFLEGKILSEAEIAEIAALQNKDALLGKVLGTMLAPITSLAVALGQVVEQKGGSLESAEPAAEEAAE